MPESAGDGDPARLPAEDAKLVTLARAARARTGTAEGAAVRDGMGRTYAASTVELASLRLSAVQAAVAAALSSGSETLEAVAVVGDRVELGDQDRQVLAEVSVSTVVLAAPDGSLQSADVAP
jgi:cytidine deaminase